MATYQKLSLLKSVYLLSCRVFYSSLPQVGSTASVTRRFTQKDVNAFVKLTEDDNTLHVNEDFAKLHGFQSVLVPGALLNGLVAGLIGSKLPGSGTVLIAEDLKFPNPLYVNEEVFVEVIIKSCRHHIIYCGFVCTNTTSSKVVLKGEAKLMLKNREE